MHVQDSEMKNVTVRDLWFSHDVVMTGDLTIQNAVYTDGSFTDANGHTITVDMTKRKITDNVVFYGNSLTRFTNSSLRFLVPTRTGT